MILISDAGLLTDQGEIELGWLRIAGEGIVERGIGQSPGDDRDVDSWNAGGAFVVPGFVDLHCHGGGGSSFSSAEPSDVVAAASFHRRHGTTTLLASLVSAPIDELVSSIKRLADFIPEGLIAGVHLEGPFLSTKHRGAHDPSLLIDPTPRSIDDLLNASPGSLRVVTLAPERTGALAAIRRIVEDGTIAAVGHTNATYIEVNEAVDAGATLATHLFNGMRPMHHREPGAIWALMHRGEVTVELINDRFHLYPNLVPEVIQQLGSDRVALVSDAIPATGLAEGNYTLGGLEITVIDGKAELSDGSSLAGSTLTMDYAFRRVVQVQGLSIADAVQVTSGTAARVLGRSDLGHLRVGARADLVVLDADLSVERVMCGGQWLTGGRS